MCERLRLKTKQDGLLSISRDDAVAIYMVEYITELIETNYLKGEIRKSAMGLKELGFRPHPGEITDCITAIGMRFVEEQ